VFAPKTFYSNNQLMAGNVNVVWEQGNFKVPIVTTTTLNDVYVLDYLPKEDIVLYQTGATAQTTLYVGILLSNGTIEQKFSITNSQLILMASPTNASKDIFSAAIARNLLRAHVYNICITGTCDSYDNRPFYVIRLDIENWSLYSDSTYDQCVYVNMNDAWGAQPNMGYHIIPSTLNSNVFVAYPTFPRTSGTVQGWQRLVKIVANDKAISLINSNGLGNMANLRWGIFNDVGSYLLMSRANNTSEGLYRISDMTKITTPNGMGCFLKNSSIDYMVVGDRTLRNMSNTQLADWSSIIPTGFNYLFGYQNILYVFYTTKVDVYEVNFTGYSLTKLRSLPCSTSQRYDTTTYSRLVQVPFSVDDIVYSAYEGRSINKFVISELTQLPDTISANTYTTYRIRNEYDAEAENILAGKKAVNQDGEVIGTMTDRTNVIITPSTTTQQLPSGYYNDNTVQAVTASIDANILPENIKDGVTILGVTGTCPSDGKIYASTTAMNNDLNNVSNGVFGIIVVNGSFQELYQKVNNVWVLITGSVSL
jgi:hypothetical protein